VIPTPLAPAPAPAPADNTRVAQPAAVYHLQHFFNRNKNHTEKQQITTCYFHKTGGISARFCIFAVWKPYKIRKVKTVVYHLQQKNK